MSQDSIVPTDARNPPVDYAVAVWLGTPKDEIEKGLREGWIRRPGVDLRGWTEKRDFVAIASPPAPGDSIGANVAEAPTIDARARIESLLRRLDSSLGESTFNDIWNAAGADEATRGARLVDFLAGAFDIRQEAGSDLNPQLSAVEQAAQGMRTSARLLRLDGMTGRELEQLAASEGGVRRALAEHSPWAFIGNRELASRGDASGRYDRFDPDTGEMRLSDAWLGDRARHAAWRSAAATGRRLEVSGDGWRFIDRAAGDAVSVELQGDGDGPANQVIFARDDGDRVNGSAATDRIHGGRGDDILRGRAGDDVLEGDAGDDVLQGGGGRDFIAGQQGDDELEGGPGADHLEGGGGIDELTGGRGDDLLRGGSGRDTYRFEPGDGVDTIEDDGGIVVIDDVTIGGTMNRSGNGWVSSDGHFGFMLEGAGSERRTLVIRAVADAAGEGRVRIADWTPGSFGIELADGSETVGGEAQNSDHGGHDGDNAAAMGETAAAGSPRASWLLTDPFDAWSAVDAQSVAQALDSWSPPSPPDIRETAEFGGVTPADIGEALAGFGQDEEGDSGAGSIALDWTFAPSLPRFDGAPKAPPDLVLRTVP